MGKYSLIQECIAPQGSSRKIIDKINLFCQFLNIKTNKKFIHQK